MFHSKGALLVNATNASLEFHRDAGITRIAPQITSLGEDNDSTATNITVMNNIVSQFGTFATVGGWGTHGSNPIQEAQHVAGRIQQHNLKFYIGDTERHWLSGYPERTDELLTELRRLLGADFPIAIITFGYSPHSQGQVINSNYAAIVKHKATFIPETYDLWGITYGMDKVIPYLEADGVPSPQIVAIGDKSVSEDVAKIKSMRKVSGIWVWASEQASDSLLQLNQVILEPPAPLPTDPIKELMEKLKLNNTGINAVLDRLEGVFDQLGVAEPDGVDALRTHLLATGHKINEVIDHLNAQ